MTRGGVVPHLQLVTCREISSPSPQVKNEVEKLPRQQRKGNLKAKMDDFTQKKQTMVRLREDPPSSRIGKCAVDGSIPPAGGPGRF